jgi:hypothetical protein
MNILDVYSFFFFFLKYAQNVDVRFQCWLCSHLQVTGYLYTDRLFLSLFFLSILMVIICISPGSPIYTTHFVPQLMARVVTCERKRPAELLEENCLVIWI